MRGRRRSRVSLVSSFGGGKWGGGHGRGVRGIHDHKN